ncbi:MAG: ATP-binding protein [Candidatus Promineifilaceae bacterium]
MAQAHFPALKLEALPAVLEFVEGAALALGGEPEAVTDLIIAVNEAVTNILAHGYASRPGALTAEVQRGADGLEVRLRDEAPPFDPTQAPAPDLSLPLEARQPGGLGAHFMRHFTDEVRHRPLPGGGNELILIKRG